MTYPNKLQTLLAEYDGLGDPSLQADFLIDLAQSFREVPASIAVRPFPESQRAPACESEAFIFCQKGGDGPRFFFAVENPQGISAKALCVILQEGLEGATSEEIQQLPEELVYRIFGRSLSMGKGAGLTGIISKVKQLSAS